MSLPSNQLLNDFLTGQSQEVKAALMDMVIELTRGEEKHPRWPSDVIHRAAVIAEESGELQRAALHLVYERGNYNEVRKEVIQTGATCLRFLTNESTLSINNTL